MPLRNSPGLNRLQYCAYRVQNLLDKCAKLPPPAETVLGRAASVDDSAVQWAAHTRETSGPARVTALPAIPRRLSMISRRAKTAVAVRHTAETGVTRACSLLQLQAMRWCTAKAGCCCKKCETQNRGERGLHQGAGYASNQGEAMNEAQVHNSQQQPASDDLGP